MEKNSREILKIMRAMERYAKRENNKIETIKYLGEIELEGKARDIYLIRELIEKQINGETKMIEIDNYITENLEKIAGNNRTDRYNFPMAIEKYDNEKDSIEKQLKDLGEEGLLDLREMEKSRVREIAKVLGLKEEEIQEVQEVDLKQEIKQEKQPKEKLAKNQLDGLQIREKTKLNQQIKGETLENKLGLKEHGIEDGDTLARVSSSSLNQYLDEPTTQVDSFVVIRKDETAVVLDEDIIEPDNRLGTNPTQKIVTANVENGDVKKEAITSSWRIVNGNGRDYLSVGYDEQYGDQKEIKYMMSSVKENDYVSIELETESTWRQDKDIRQYMKERGEGTRAADNAIDRDKQHEECEKEEVQDIDNDKNNDTHTHNVERAELNPEQKIPDTDITWKDLAERCQVSVEEVYNKFQKERESASVDKKNEEIVEEVEQQINEEYMHGGMQRG